MVITAQDDHLASKRMVAPADVFESPVDGFEHMPMHHGSLIPSDDPGGSDETCYVAFAVDIAGGVLLDVNGNLETRMSGPSPR